MVNQKAENILNLALDTSESEREKSSELNVGYNPIDQFFGKSGKLVSGYYEDLRQEAKIESGIEEIVYVIDKRLTTRKPFIVPYPVNIFYRKW